MKAVVITQPGGAEVLSLQEVADPQPGVGEVVIDVYTSALNRADLLQRQGVYPPPAGAHSRMPRRAPVAELRRSVCRTGRQSSEPPRRQRVAACIHRA